MVETIEFLKQVGIQISTQLGAERGSNSSGRMGTIVGFSSANTSVRVLFDGTKTLRALNPS
jgi:hypothetical protein